MPRMTRPRDFPTWGEDLDRVYRVELSPDTKTVNVICIGMGKVDKQVEGDYHDTSELPKWMQAKLAVLSLTEVNPPQKKVEGVGIRVDQNVYWVLGS